MSRLTQAIDANRRRSKEQQDETATSQTGGKSILRQAIDQARSGERVERATGVPLSQTSVGLIDTGRDGVGATPSTTRPSVMSTLRQTTPFSFSPFQFLTTRPSGGSQSGSGQQQASTPNATMSSTDMSARMDELRELRDAAEKERNEARLIMTGSRYMPSSMREEQQAILDQAEADYARYDQEYNDLLSRYYQTENEEKRASLQQDEAMSAQYQSAQDIQSDMDKVTAVMAYTTTHDGDAAQVEEYKNYLFEKYGLDQKAIDQYAIAGTGGAYVPRTDGGYNNIYDLYLELEKQKEQAVSALAEGGYDYERMTGYTQMQEDAERYQENLEEWQQYAREHPILSSVGSLLVAPFQGFDFARVMLDNMGHGDTDDPENYVPMNSYTMDATNYVNTVRQSVSEDIEENTDWELFGQNVASFLYQTGMSIGDSTLNLAAFGPTGALVVGSSTAAANQAKDIIDRGGTKEQAFMGGLAAGAFEAIFEKVSIDNLLATKSVTGWKTWLKETAKQAGVEASEETFTEIANILADAAIMGDNSNYDAAVREYIAQGMSQEDAERQAFMDLIGQIVQAGVGGALSGGVMGGTVNAVNGMANAAYNRYNQQQSQENTAKNGTVLETTAQETEEQRQNTAEIDNDIPEATRAAIEMLVNGEEISGNQAARIAQNEEAVALLSQLTGEEVNTDAPISRVKSDIRALASRESARSADAGVNSQGTQRTAQVNAQTATARPSAQQRTAAQAAFDMGQMRQAAEMSGFGESGRRALTASYDGTTEGNAYFAGFTAYYNAGMTGMDMDRVQNIYARDLTQAQQYAAYAAGQNDAAASLQREQESVQFATVYGDEAGLIENENAARIPQQTAALYNTLAKAAGVKIELVDQISTPSGEDGGNGLYLPGRGTIQISMNAQGATQADGTIDAGAFAAVAAHEITHRIQDLAPEEYRKYRDYAVQAVGEAEGGTEFAVETRRRLYAQNGINLTTEQAMDEIAANFTRNMLEDSDLFENLARTDRSLARRVLDALKDFIRRVNEAFSSRSRQNQAARSAYGVDMSTLEEAARLWQAAYDAAARQTRQAAGQTESAAQGDGAGRFSIQYDQDNNPYVVIEEDILAGVPRSEWVKTVKDNLRQKFPDGVTVGNNVIEIDKQSREEMTYSRYTRHLMRTEPELYADKLRATNNADEILRASRNYVNEALAHPRRDNIQEFARGEVLMEIGDKGYSAQVVVAMRSNGRLLLYDILQMEPATIQAKNKKSNAAIAKDPSPGTDRSTASGFTDSISETGGDVNGRFSLKERDREYLSAVESGNTEEAQRLVNEAAEAAMSESKIRGQDGRLTPVYHGTREMFWRFDTSVQGGVNGTAEGFGIYTSDNPEVTAAYGDRQLKMFANITNPATSTSKTITPKTLAALIKSTCEREARQQVADGEYDSVRDALRDTWVSNYTDTYSSSMAQVYRDVARSILDMNDSDMDVIREVMTGMGIRDYADASDFYENSLIPITGIDGFVTQWENRESGTPSNIILALNSNQLKSADTITRDDSGEIIPLSKRFNPEEGDIRYSLKSTDSQGRNLTAEQQEFFRDSKITDAEGRLLVLYHGTTTYGEITKFRRGRSGWLGPGIYLASRRSDAQRYADAMGEGNGQLYELYANVTNPLVVTEGNPVPEILRAAYGRDSIYKSRSAKQSNDTHIITPADIKKLQGKGYDGIQWNFGGNTEVSVFSAEQIKRVDNQTPTSDPDIRRSIKGSDILRENAALQEENALLRERVEYWRGQTRRTERVTTNKRAVERAARELIRAYDADLDVSDISGDLQSLYDYIASGRDGNDELTYTEARRRADAIARKLVDNAVVRDDGAYQEYSDLRSYLRTTPLSISEEDSHDIPDYGDFRRRNFGRLNLTRGRTNIDQVYQEMSQMWPEFFDEQRESHPTDQLLHIVDVLDEIYRVTESNPFSGYFNEAVADASNEIMERFFDLPQTKPTFADRQARRLDDARARGRQQVERVRAQRDARLAELRQQNRERVQRVIQRERETRARQLERLRSRYAARDAAGRERRSARELRARISRHVSDLSRRLLRPSDKQHIPEQLRSAVAAMLDAINLESVYTVDPETGKRRKGGNGNPTKRTEAFRALRQAYADISKEGSDYTLIIDPDLMDNLSELEAMRDTPLAEMGTSQLATVWSTIKAVEASIRTANRMLGESRFQTISQVAEGIRSDNIMRQDRGDYRGVLGKVDKLVNLDMLTPQGYFHRLGKTGDALFQMLRSAQDRHIEIMRSAQQATQDIIGKTNVGQLEREMHTFDIDGQKVTMSTAQVMALYELMKRKQAQEHIFTGGIRPDTVRGGRGLRENRRADAVHVSIEDLAEITGVLTEEQVKIADALQKYMGGQLADLGNEASMEVYGYRKFTEPDYFPIQVDRNQTRQDIAKEAQAQTIAGRGFTKGTNPNANNAVMVGSIFDIFASHVNDMATYAAWLPTMENVRRIRDFTYRDSEGNRTGTVKSVIERVFGRNGNAYLNKLVDDLNQGVRTTGSGNFMDGIVGNYKAAAVAANLRVILQQPTAILRALNTLDAKYLMAGTVRRGNWERVMQYAPIARWKDWGYFDINTGRQMKDVLLGSDSRLEKIKQAGMAGAGRADSFAWSRLWNAVESETKDRRPGLKPGTDAFYRAVAERFGQIIDQTQVVDGILQRSQIMRSPDALTKMSTSFMGEPTKTYNMFVNAVYDLRHATGQEARSRAGKALARTSTALVVSFTVNAIMQSIIDGLRDDDKETDYWEKVFQAFTGFTGDEETFLDYWNSFWSGNLEANYNPLAYMPYFKDLVSIAQGFDVTRMDMEAVEQVWTAFSNMRKALSGEGRYSIAGASANMLAEVARLFGLPVANLKRDVQAVATTAAIETDNYLLQYEIDKALLNMGYQGNRSNFMNILYAASVNDPEAYEIIYEDMVANGVTEEQIRTAMESRMKEEQGVESVSDLTRRYLTPTQERTYGRLYGQISSSPVWSAANAEQRAAVEEDLYNLTVGTDAGLTLREKIDAGAAYGISEADYLLYLAAREIADAENEDPEKRNGSIDQAEAQAAIDMLTGLSDEGRAYLWQSTNKGWKADNNPYQ